MGKLLSQNLKFFRFVLHIFILTVALVSPVRGQQNISVEKVSGYDWIKVSRSELVAGSSEVMSLPDIPFRTQQIVHRVRAVDMDWDIAGSVYEPEDPSKIPLGPDGKKVGVFLLHGGSGDHRSKEKFAQLLVSKFGFKVVNMSYPGRYNLQEVNGNWPGDTIKADGSVRTPIWLKDELITPDQYEVVKDQEESRRRRWGTLHLACAKPGTTFYNRMAGWPVAHEEGATDLARRYFPEDEYSIYSHGHSTGGPMTMMLTQHIPNIVGVLGMESSPFGALYGNMTREIQGISEPWGMNFDCLRIRSWRDTARYYGYELIQEEGGDALARLAMVMEEVHDNWQKGTKQPHFKAENILHFDNPAALESAARVTADRLEMTSEATESLVERYLGYLRGISGPRVKPVPPLILIITKNSRDHAPENYRDVYLPGYAAMKPAPKVKLYQFDAGIHGYSAAEEGLPLGVAPMGIKLWYDAIMSGYFLK
ncbi:MAG: hypothetical protein ACI9XC_000645 [Gammaproteobacteria bacterium]